MQFNMNKKNRQQMNDDDSDDEDEIAEQIGKIMKEFIELKDVTEKLFKFILFFVFDKDPTSLNIIQQYQQFENFLSVNMF